MKEKDMVNHPDHYTNGDIECIDAIEAALSYEGFCGMLKGNVIKYLWRYEHKGKGLQDLEKAKWYQDRLIKTVTKQHEKATKPNFRALSLEEIDTYVKPDSKAYAEEKVNKWVKNHQEPNTGFDPGKTYLKDPNR